MIPAGQIVPKEWSGRFCSCSLAISDDHEWLKSCPCIGCHHHRGLWNQWELELTSKEDLFLKKDCGREKPEKKQIAQIGLRTEPSPPRRPVPFWISEEYAVLPELVEDILEQFKVRPEVDAFACNGNQQFARWWGPGSLEHEDAFTCDWGKELLWANPPFSLLQRVVQKIVKDAAHIVLVVPVWPRKDWYQEAENLSILTLSCPAGQQVFQLQGKKNAKKPSGLLKQC